MHSYISQVITSWKALSFWFSFLKRCEALTRRGLVLTCWAFQQGSHPAAQALNNNNAESEILIRERELLTPLWSSWRLKCYLTQYSQVCLLIVHMWHKDGNEDFCHPLNPIWEIFSLGKQIIQASKLKKTDLLLGTLQKKTVVMLCTVKHKTGEFCTLYKFTMQVVMIHL